MDVYSLGVLLFVMLVGRKPWDSQRSHTLQYAVYSSAEAPGLADPSFLALSGTVRQLLLQMLAELPEARPSAAAVLAHPWMRQGAQVGGWAGWGRWQQLPVCDAHSSRSGVEWCSI